LVYQHAECHKQNPFDGKNIRNLTMQLRKIANHPILFMESYYQNHDYLVKTSGKVELVDRILPKLQRAGHRVLMFTQMVEMIKIMTDYFTMAGLKHMVLDGGTDADKRGADVEEFNNPDSDVFIFILSTRAGGLGLNLQSADTVIIFDSDWNPMSDEQAKARAHRIGQKKEVIILRLVTEGTVEEHMLQTAQTKLENEAMVIQAGMFHEEHDADESRRRTMDLIQRGRDGLDEADLDQAELRDLNRRIARSESEAQQYDEWDQEQINLGQWASARQWMDSRLMQESGLEHFLAVHPEVKERITEANNPVPSDEAQLGLHGKRKRTKTTYSDSLTEAQWLEQIGSVIKDDDVAPNTKRRRNSTHAQDPTSSPLFGDPEDDDGVESLLDAVDDDAMADWGEDFLNFDD